MNTPDFYSMYARKLLGMPEEWRWTRLETKDGGGGRRYTLLTGAIAATTYKRGPNKGQLNWRGPLKDKFEVIISEEEHNQFIADWERETGLCGACGSSGQELAGWSAESGSRYRPCRKCGEKARGA